MALCSTCTLVLFCYLAMRICLRIFFRWLYCFFPSSALSLSLLSLFFCLLAIEHHDYKMVFRWYVVISRTVQLVQLYVTFLFLQIVYMRKWLSMYVASVPSMRLWHYLWLIAIYVQPVLIILLFIPYSRFHLFNLYRFLFDVVLVCSFFFFLFELAFRLPLVVVNKFDFCTKQLSHLNNKKILWNLLKTSTSI